MQGEKGYCPICGRVYYGPFEDHRCPESVLRAIDAAHNRDPDERLEHRIPEGRRLSDGFALIDPDGDEDEDPTE